MTITPGLEWGESTRLPHDALVAVDEAGLGRALTQHLQSRVSRPLAVALMRGDLLTALGCAVGQRVEPPRVGEPCRLLPCDAYEVTLESGSRTTTTLAVSSVVVGSAVRPVWWLTSGGFLGRSNLIPNCHPNDGRADALVWSTGKLREILAIRQRMRLGTHLPHPHLDMARGATVQWRGRSTARRVVIDGRSFGRATAVTVAVRPDAFCLVMATP